MIIYLTTVEPPRKGHFGEMVYVPCREVVPISEVCLFFHCSTLIQVCFQYVMNYLQSGLVMITVSSDSIYSGVAGATGKHGNAGTGTETRNVNN